MKIPSAIGLPGLCAFLTLICAAITSISSAQTTQSDLVTLDPASLPPSKLGVSKPMPPFIIGADISSVQQSEDRGVKYSDGGVTKDIFAILKDHGFNYIRLRVFVDPTVPTPRDRPYSPQGYCDLPHTILMAKRAKAAGMGLLIDFHYSDSWADPSKQFTPSAWANLSFDDLVKKTHDWTFDAVSQLKAAGAEPDMVQVGNEITPGMMVDHGGSTRDWDQLSQLLKAGLAGVEDVDPKIITMLHIDLGGNNRRTVQWVNNALSRGVRFDVLGESCYTQWQGQPETWKANFEDLEKRYPNLYFVCAEIADAVRPANDIMHDLPDHRGLGTFIWEPTQNGNRQGLFTTAARGGRRPTTAPTLAVTPATRPAFVAGAVIPARMGLYDQIVKDYGLAAP
ncbi:MAG: glycosyl hydrolase 53 family protein [Tepidisphaeraceae bacterium]